MAHAFMVEVMTAERLIFTGPAISVVAPATDGYLGVWSDHAPMLAGLATGRVTVTREGGKLPIELAVSGGVLDVMPDRVRLLADTAELAEEIDRERARQAAERAEERLRAHPAELDVDRAQAALQRALNRLRVADTPRM